MCKITFRYRDRYTNGKWKIQTCTALSVQQCIAWYGLEDIDCEYEIISVEEE